MNSVNELNKLQHNERSRYSDQSEIRVLTTGGTLLQAVEGILTKKQFWASSINCLNDTDEQWYCVELFYNSVLPNLDVNKLMNHKNEKFRNSFLLDILDIHKLNMIPNFINGYMNTYVISLTENDDSLYLWSSYSDGFFGYNLEIDVEEIIRCSTQINPEIKFIYGKVLYDKNEQIKKLRDTFEYIIRACENIEDSDTAYGMFANMFLYYSIFFKRECFKYEEEFRLAYVLHKEINNNPLIKLRFNQMPIPYLCIELNESVFKSICIGPKNTSKIIFMGLNEFKRNIGFDSINISCSKIKLR